jgi:hypothetical protein
MFLISPMFSSSSSTVSGLILQALIYLEFISVPGERDLVSVFYMWISSFPTTTCKRGCGFSNVYFWHAFHESDSCSFLGLFLELQFYSSGPFVCCVAVPYCYGCEVYFQVRRGISNIAFCKQQLHPITYIYTFKKNLLINCGASWLFPKLGYCE